MQIPKNNDDETRARRWRGALFSGLRSPIGWIEDDGKSERAYHHTLQAPGSVTFPICAFCRHIVWEWPHFEEPVPENATCDACWKEQVDAD